MVFCVVSIEMYIPGRHIETAENGHVPYAILIQSQKSISIFFTLSCLIKWQREDLIYGDPLLNSMKIVYRLYSIIYEVPSYAIWRLKLKLSLGIIDH